MEHLIEYNSYEIPSFLNESGIPVYDEQKYIKNVHADPEMKLSPTQICPTIQSLLERVKSGELKKVSVIADIPTQGKNAPQYLRDLMAKERRRLGIKYTRNPEEFPEGGRIEKRRGPEETYDEFTGEINVFIDSEFVAYDVVKEDKKSYILTVPFSYYLRTKDNTSLRDYYTTKISPERVEEIHYTKA